MIPLTTDARPELMNARMVLEYADGTTLTVDVAREDPVTGRLEHVEFWHEDERLTPERIQPESTVRIPAREIHRRRLYIETTGGYTVASAAWRDAAPETEETT